MSSLCPSVLLILVVIIQLNCNGAFLSTNFIKSIVTGLHVNQLPPVSSSGYQPHILQTFSTITDGEIVGEYQRINKTALTPFFRLFYKTLTTFESPQDEPFEAHFVAVKHLQAVLTLVKCTPSSLSAHETASNPSIPRHSSLSGKTSKSSDDDSLFETEEAQASGNNNNSNRESDGDGDSAIHHSSSTIAEKRMPSEYIHVLLFVNDLLTRLNQSSSSATATTAVYKLLRLVAKEEGFRSMLRVFFPSKDAHEISETDIVEYKVPSSTRLSSRDVVETKRKIERLFSMSITLLISYKITLARNISADFLYFAKALIESTPSTDKHFSLLLYCRGLFPNPSRYRRQVNLNNNNNYYYYNNPQQQQQQRQQRQQVDLFGDPVQPSVVMGMGLSAGGEACGSNNDFQVVSGEVEGLNTAVSVFPGLLSSYRSSMEELSINQFSKPCRTMYPFLVTMSRFYSSLLQEQEQEQEQEQLQDVVRRSNEDGYTTSNNSNSSTSARRRRYTQSDARVSKFLQKCLEIDRCAAETNDVMNHMQADEMLCSLYRWTGDMFALHFIRQMDDLQLHQQQELQEEVVKMNSVAMELLSTHSCFVEGRARDTHSFMEYAAQMGKVFHTMFVLSNDNDYNDNNSSSSSSSHVQYAYNDDPYFLMNVKKLMAVVGFARRSSKNHPLTFKLLTQLGLQQQQISSSSSSLSSKTNIPYRWANQLMKLRRSKDIRFRELNSSRGESVSNEDNNEDNNDEDDDSIWGGTNDVPLKYRRTKKKKTKASNLFSKPSIGLSPSLLSPLMSSTFKPRIVATLQTLLPEILRHIMSTTTTAVRVSDTMLEEIDYIFSTWRRPHLLLDYFMMHRSSQELQSVYILYLQSLFGATDATVDDIRSKDPGNTNHFKHMSQELVEDWFNVDNDSNNNNNGNGNGNGNGTSTGRKRALPGFTDPQTLFMLGEDCNTCMSIRSKQKGSNRGLMSIVLHGNCRVLGLKDHDAAGKMSTRAVVRLLVDEATKSPLLYVDSPFGDTSPDNVLEIFDQAAELGDILQLPVVYASPPPSEDAYCMGPTETTALVLKDESLSLSPENIDGDEDQDRNRDLYLPLVNVTDYSTVAPFIWADGIKDPISKSYLARRNPRLIRVKRVGLSNVSVQGNGNTLVSPMSLWKENAGNKKRQTDASSGVTTGARPEGFLEHLISTGFIVDNKSVPSES